MSALLRRAGLAAAALTVLAPAAADAAPVAPPKCIHASPFAGADFGAFTNPARAGTAIAFDGSCSKATADIGLSSVTPDEWVWSFGDGASGSGPKPSHTYAAPGRYTVTMTEWGEY